MFSIPCGLWSKSILIFLIFTQVHQIQGVVPEDGTFNQIEPYSNKWRAEVQDAVAGAGEQLERNLLFTLTTLATRGIGISRHGKFLLGKLLVAVVNRSFNFAGMVVSLPKLLVDDFPTQFVQVLKLMRNEPGLTRDTMNTIDSLIGIVERAQASGLSQFIFKPVTNVLPNLLSGVNKFLEVIFDGVFYLIGARDPYQTVHLTKSQTSTMKIPEKIN